MTMTVRDHALDPAPVPAVPMTWEQWLAFEPEDGAGRYELVEGVPVVTPPESALNHWAVMQLGARILAATAREFAPMANAGIRTKGEPASTGRQADLLVVSREAVRETLYFAGEEVVLAVECVSVGSSDERDWVTKRAEYARVGVQAYLVVDRARGQLVLFDEIVDGVYSRRQEADPQVTLRLGRHRIPVSLDQLVD